MYSCGMYCHVVMLTPYLPSLSLQVVHRKLTLSDSVLDKSLNGGVVNEEENKRESIGEMRLPALSVSPLPNSVDEGVCTYVRTCLCAHMYVHVCVHICTCVCAHMYVHACVCTCTVIAKIYVRMYVCMYVYVCTYVCAVPTLSVGPLLHLRIIMSSIYIHMSSTYLRTCHLHMYMLWTCS